LGEDLNKRGGWKQKCGREYIRRSKVIERDFIRTMVRKHHGRMEKRGMKNKAAADTMRLVVIRHVAVGGKHLKQRTPHENGTPSSVTE